MSDFMSELETVGIFLGPYRNLTTLTAVSLWLHPHCQVLNHGLRPLMAAEATELLAPEDSESFRKFLETAVSYSTRVIGVDECSPHSIMPISGIPVITESVTRSFRELNGRPPEPFVKNPMRSFVWKESQAVTSSILHTVVPWSETLGANTKLRFILPIRDPADVAISNHRQGKWSLFDGIDTNSPRVLLRAVLAEMAWFLGLETQYPDRFFHFHDFWVGHGVLPKLANFLGLDPLPAWQEAVKENWSIRHPYRYSPEFMHYYEEIVRLHFSTWPGAMEHFYHYSVVNRDSGRVGELPARDWDVQSVD